MGTEREKINILKIADFTDKSLLIVDDDNPLRDRLSRAMEKKGFKVIQAESVKNGISQAKNVNEIIIIQSYAGWIIIMSRIFLIPKSPISDRAIDSEVNFVIMALYMSLY